MFETEFENLNHEEQQLFKHALNNLLFHCFVLRKMYDRQRKIIKINPDYIFIEKYQDLFQDYLKYSDLEINVDDSNGVIKLVSLEGRNTLRIDGSTTLLVFLLRYYYEKQILEKPDQIDVYMDVNDIKILLKEKGFSKLNKKFNLSSISQGMKILSKYYVVCRLDNNWDDSYYSFLIRPSIRHVISLPKMDVLIKEIDNNEEKNDEDTII